MSIDLTTHLKSVSAIGTIHTNDLYLVGGTLRDHFLGRRCMDYDFTAHGAKKIAGEFSATKKFPLVKLDNTPGRETFRVVLQENFYFDFTEMQGSTIKEDLSQRDFTINAMAIHLDDFLQNKNAYLDPFDGQGDIQRKSVKKIPGPVFNSDPLRMLRAFRFASALGFSIDTVTLDQIALHRDEISNVSVERIYYEWILILESSVCTEALQTMNKIGLLQSVFPEIGQMESTSQWDHCLSACRILDATFSGSCHSMPLQIDPGYPGLPIRKQALLKFAALLVPWTTAPDNMDAKVTALMRRMHASNTDRLFLLHSLQIYQTIMHSQLDFVSQRPESPAMIYQFVKQSADELIPAVILAWSCMESNPAKDQENFFRSIQNVLDFYFRTYLPAQGAPMLMDGTTLQDKFKLPPSPLFRTILDHIEEGRVLGTIKNRTEAEVAVQKLINAQ